MSGPIKLSSPRYRVVLGDAENPDTWQALEVQAITPDLAAAEALFVRHKWGKPAESAIKLTSVAAYYALKRTGQIDGSWEDFAAAYLEVGEAGVDVISPTDRDPETD